MRHSRNPGNTQGEGKSKVETGAEATKPNPTHSRREPGIENRSEPMNFVSESKKTPSCFKWACGRRPSHASTGQQRSTQKNPHRDAMQRPTNRHMRAHRKRTDGAKNGNDPRNHQGKDLERTERLHRRRQYPAKRAKSKMTSETRVAK